MWAKNISQKTFKWLHPWLMQHPDKKYFVEIASSLLKSQADKHRNILGGGKKKKETASCEHGHGDKGS